MHDIKTIRDNPQAFDAALKAARAGADVGVAAGDRREAPRGDLASEQAQARRNSASKEIGDAKKAKDDARAAS